MTVSNFELIKEFDRVMGVSTGNKRLTEEEAQLAIRLIHEEMQELDLEFFPESETFGFFYTENQDRERIAKELADVLYVTYQLADRLGINADKAFRAVHESNMSKLVDGKPVRREDGKIMKGPNYVPPNMEVAV